MAANLNKGEHVIRGIPVSEGVCRGRILMIDQPAWEPTEETPIPEEELTHQLKRLEEALVETRREILQVQRQVTEGLGAKDAGIFDAHLLVLEDPTLIEEVSRCIFTEKVSAEYAFQKVAEKYMQTLRAISDEYLKERSADMRDVASRVMNNLLGRQDAVDLTQLEEPGIIISHDVSPTRTAQMDKKMVLGFGTEVGGRTSHSAIMARALRIPAVVGLGEAIHEMRTGDSALLDGYNGLIIINPSDQTLFEYGQIVRKQVTLEENLKVNLDQPAVTLDGHRITLSANIEQLDDASQVASSGAEGVGLFRTEYLFIGRAALPDEEEQYMAYRRVASAVKPAPVVFRTLDLGGDKLLSHLDVPSEMNPFLGWRAIRFCLQQKDIFRAQLRALLRASAEGNVKIMYPMISGLGELKEANQLVEVYKQELSAEGMPYDANVELGAMIEIPSAALIAGELAEKVSFFSIGTNDLIQYSLAVDRLNEKIAYLYQPTHPAIIRLIKMSVDAARAHGITISVCGEMASDPKLTPLLVGLGVDELSMSTGSLPQIKYLIRRLKRSDAEALAEKALTTGDSADILSATEACARRVAPALFETSTPTASA